MLSVKTQRLVQHTVQESEHKAEAQRRAFDAVLKQQRQRQKKKLATAGGGAAAVEPTAARSALPQGLAWCAFQPDKVGADAES